ncbi:acetate--CoA ligase family protein [Leucobacter sp. wl10]|uniref:acetate--CoA ligase family protein n=1 Tax=Leucobacter sp. wl10 TaxID=2304677 RepID=UPI000E5C33FC|nr:acetate--CoA ligase family protein [Leucobacter sp. wl10]RGE18950.1 CoA-binding protein [Leucobacter sp. wl10]
MRDLGPLLRPRIIAVVGASSNLRSPSGKPVRFLRESGADVTVYPVNPVRDEVAGYRAYPDPSALPEAPDVAVVVTPGSAVIPAVEALAERGARAVVVITSGFAEGSGDEGVAAQRRLREIAGEHDMVLLGPNTLGIHDYARGIPLSFVWYGERPIDDSGAVAVVSQSGSGMTSLCDRLLTASVPVGFGVATGNEADLTVVDLLEHFAADDSVRVIVTVFEEIREGARFIEVCRRLRAAGKPLIALKAGRTESGAAMVKSHTGALAGAYPVLRALLRQNGVIEVEDLDEVPPMAAAALLGAYPDSGGIAVVTNSGGAAALAADRADEIGAPLAQLGPETREQVRANLPEFAQGRPVSNPIDVTAQNVKRPRAIAEIAAALVDDPGVGGVLVALASAGGPDGLAWVDRLIELARASPKPIVAVILSGQESEGLRNRLRAGGVPVLSSPAMAVDTLHRLHRFGASRRAAEAAEAMQPIPQDPVPLPDDASEFTTLHWLREYGVPVVEQRLATTPAEAAEAAEAIGFPVAVKICSPDIAHKTEAGGVALDLKTAEEVSAATERVLGAAAGSAPDAVIQGVTVSPMVEATLELISGIHEDPTFGPVVLLGLGGVWAEVLGDVTMRGLPLAHGASEGMVADLQGAALLRGARGRAAADPAALERLVRALARIAADHGDRLQSLDLNPVAITTSGEVVVLDAALFARPPVTPREAR